MGRKERGSGYDSMKQGLALGLALLWGVETSGVGRKGGMKQWLALGLALLWGVETGGLGRKGGMIP